MPRRFRLLGKKRGSRRTGSRLLGGIGEAMFGGVMFLFGSIALTAVIASQVIDPDPRVLGFGFGFWLLVAVLSSFVLLGIGSVIRSIFNVGASAERRSAIARRAANIDLQGEKSGSPTRFPNVPKDENQTNSPGVKLRYRLPVAQSPVWRLFAAFLFCLIWNGAGTVLVVLVIDGFLGDHPEWFLTLFTIPFLAIGGWSIYDFARQMLIHTGIGPTNLELANHPLRAGETYDLYLSQSGRLLMKHFSVRLVCEEKATFRQGTDLRTEIAKVFDQQVMSEKDFSIQPGVPFEGDYQFQIPADAMHSFQSEHNSINWMLVVRGRAQSWPPFQRKFPIVVVPRSSSETETHGTAHLASIA